MRPSGSPPTLTSERDGPRSATAGDLRADAQTLSHSKRECHELHRPQRGATRLRPAHQPASQGRDLILYEDYTD
jgi:hypothetical protein